MKIGIVGSRIAKGISLDLIRKNIPDDCTLIISGGALGVDSMAEKIAKEMNIPFLKYLPDYDLFGNKAPLIRNTQIVQKSERVLAFWDYKSRGTAHTIRECIRLNVPVKIVSIK